MQRSYIISVIVAVLVLCGLSYFLHQRDAQYDLPALLAGTLLLAFISLVSFYVISRGLRSDNSYALMRAKYTGTMIKFFGCIAAVLAYVFVNERQVHRPTLFLFLGMYIVFSALEAVPLSRMAKKH